MASPDVKKRKLEGVIIDLEAFMLGKNNIVYRQLSYLTLDGTKSGCIEIYTPDVYYNKLTEDEKKTVRYCTRYVHGLVMAYGPKNDGKTWMPADDLHRFLLSLYRLYGRVLYKGGTLEKDLCDKLNIPCVDLAEVYGIPRSVEVGVPCPNHDAFHAHCSYCDVFSYKKALEECCFL